MCVYVHNVCVYVTNGGNIDCSFFANTKCDLIHESVICVCWVGRSCIISSQVGDLGFVQSVFSKKCRDGPPGAFGIRAAVNSVLDNVFAKHCSEAV